jgi:chromate transporter
LPAVLLVLGLAWFYVEYDTTTDGGWLLYAIKPVIIVVVVQAIWGLGRTEIKGAFLAVIGLTVLALDVSGVNEILLLFGAAALVKVIHNRTRLRPCGTCVLSLAPWWLLALPPLLAVADAKVPYLDSRMFLTFVKIGAVLYGSGYVLLAVLRNDFVDRLGWLTEEQILDAVAGRSVHTRVRLHDRHVCWLPR